MRVGIVSASMTQLGIMAELLKPLIPMLTIYDQEAIDNGTFQQSYDNVVIIDYSVDSIMEADSVINALEKDEPKCILSERNLYPLAHDERLAWRNKIIAEIKKLVPDAAAELTTVTPVNKPTDVWIIGSSSGGPDALINFLANLPALPISLMIIQHIGSDSGSVSVQSVLNSRQSRWPVEICSDGAPIKQGHAYLVQRDSVVAVEGTKFTTRPYQLANQPSPSINATVRSVCRSTEGNVGAIILTGLGDDGSASLKEVKHKLIKVYAQSSEDCAARSMPEAARQAGVVDESSTAAGIAKLLSRHYGIGTV